MTLPKFFKQTQRKLENARQFAVEYIDKTVHEIEQPEEFTPKPVLVYWRGVLLPSSHANAWYTNKKIALREIRKRFANGIAWELRRRAKAKWDDASAAAQHILAELVRSGEFQFVEIECKPIAEENTCE